MLLISSGLLCYLDLSGQASSMDVVSIEVLENQDTVKTLSRTGKWWFGPIVGYNGNFYFNTLNTNLFYNTDNPFNIEVDYKSGTGSGWYTGLNIEYQEPKKYWGFGTDIYFPDVRHATSKTEEVVNEEDYSIYYTSTYKYISVAPYARYNFARSGLHVFAGPGVDFNYAALGAQKIVEEAVDDIIHDDSLTHSEMKARFGLNVGAGWDIMVSDIDSRVRVRFLPYVSGHLGTKILGDFGSNWNEVLFKAGLKIKFGPTKQIIDTSEYRYVEETPIYLASIVPESGVEFKLDRTMTVNLPAMEIAYVEKTKDETMMIFPDDMTETMSLDSTIAGQLAALGSETEPAGSEGADIDITPEPDVINIPDRGISVVLPRGKEKNISIELDKTYSYSFETSTTTELSESLSNYLDELIKELKANPNLTVIIIGHSDNRAGNTQTKLRISQERAQNAKSYMVKRGIPGTRIFPRGQSDLFPLKSNNTEEGRRANRRVEIRVISQ